MEWVSKTKILVVEDEEEWRRQVDVSLTDAGYEVLPARDATEAMNLAEEPSLGLMMVDDDLAGESGKMLAKFLRRNHPDVPILLCTNTSYNEAQVLSLMDQGIEQCMTKGSLEEMIVTVGSCVR